MSVLLFVMLLSCLYYCLWCYYHVSIIVCDVIRQVHVVYHASYTSQLYQDLY